MISRLISTMLLLLCFNARGQMSGTEQVVPKQVYTGNFHVHGDKDTYYPVVFKSGDQNRVNHLRVFRSYGEAGPNELSSTHKGGLALEIDVNYGGWGGAAYDWRVMDLRQMYHETFAGAAIAMHNIGFVVWLRGGGFLYHYESEKPANLQVAYSSTEKIFDHANNSYDVYAPAPKTSPDDDLINAHKNDHWDYLKGTEMIGEGWARSGSHINYSVGNVGIGTATPQNALDVNGAIRAKDLVVDSAWADHVFADGYALLPLAEVEAHIAANRRLPGVPSAEEVAANGVSIGESQSILLEKVEELTLYAIEQERANEELRKAVADKDAELSALQRRTLRLEALAGLAEGEGAAAASSADDSPQASADTPVFR